MGDIGIVCGAALGGTAIAQQAGGHAAELALPMSHDRPPGRAGAA